MRRLRATTGSIVAAIAVAAQYAHAQGKLDSFETAKLIGVNITVQEGVNNLMTVLQFTAIPIATAMFVVGAFFYVFGADNEERKNKGKDFMIGSLIGVGIVMGAKAILNLTLYFIYG